MPDRLTIRAIETIPIRVSLGRTYQGSSYRMTHRSTIVTRVHTDEGVVGEAYAGDEDAGLLEIDHIIRQEIAPRLIGEDALAVERCWELARPATFDILRDRRRGLVACACVDTAVWDAIGRALGQPLWRLWGGYRSKLPMIAIGGYYDENADLAAEVAELKELGLAGLKLKVGGLEPEQDAKRARLAREAGGDGFILAADANQGWTPEQAVRFARLVEDCHLVWLEEPCRWANDRRAMRDVRFAAGTRICAGQSEYSSAGCRDLMVEGAIDVCNFDASWSGGPTEWRRVAGWRSPSTYRWRTTRSPRSRVTSSLVDGMLELGSAPGLGWELDADFIEAYRLT